MNLEKAIALLRQHRAELDSHTYEATQDAIKLGIEALYFKQVLKAGRVFPHEYLLPGETE